MFEKQNVGGLGQSIKLMGIWLNYSINNWIEWFLTRLTFIKF